MAYRSPKNKEAIRQYSRRLYVEDKRSLDEIREETGEAMRTLKTWSDLEDWETQREEYAKTDRDRMESLRGSLLDKIEAQFKAEKLPHTEIGLLYKTERLIIQRGKKEEKAITIVGNTIQHLLLYLTKHDPKLARGLAKRSHEFFRWIVGQDVTRLSEELSRLLQVRTLQQHQEFVRSLRKLTHPYKEPTPQQQAITRRYQRRARRLQAPTLSWQEINRRLQAPTPSWQEINRLLQALRRPPKPA